MSKAKKASPVSSARLTAPGYILALDMSLAHTGYALANVGTGEITKGVIEPKNLRGMERLAFLRTIVLNLAQWAQLDVPPPDFYAIPKDVLVFIEGYAFGARGQAVISLGELGGTIRLALWEARIPYLEIPPARVKKFVTGSGNANKNVMLKEVFKRFDGEDINDDNIADAFSLMQLGLAVCGKNTKPLVQFQEQVVSEVVKAATKEQTLAQAA